MAARSHHGIDSPKNYLPLSIFTLLCCFWPLGLIALIFSLKVNSASSNEEAESASKTAKWLNIAGIIIGALLLVGVTVFLIVYYTAISPTTGTRVIIG